MKGIRIMRESRIEDHLEAEAGRLGGWAPKWVSPGNAGVPDRIVMLPGKPCPTCGRAGSVGFLETKAPGDRPRPLQLRQLERLAGLGLPAGWASSRKGVESFVAGLAGRRVQ
jgi:hypothetical protein